MIPKNFKILTSFASFLCKCHKTRLTLETIFQHTEIQNITNQTNFNRFLNSLITLNKPKELNAKDSIRLSRRKNERIIESIKNMINSNIIEI